MGVRKTGPRTGSFLPIHGQNRPANGALEEKVKKQEVIAAILACAEKLGRVPTIPELMKNAGIDRPEIRKHFGNYTQALEECQFETPGWAKTISPEMRFQDWAEVARALQRLPSIFDYERLGKYSTKPLRRMFGSWLLVPQGMKLYAEEHGLEEKWKDVLEMVNAQAAGRRGSRGGGLGGGRSGGTAARAAWAKMAEPDGRPTYGPLIRSRVMVYGPTNEMGVVCLFSSMAEELGFLILRIQTGFPDCEAMRVVEGGRLQPVKIEFEHESKNFLKHMHDLKGCDMIVCWEHNWEECPLEVLELKRYCQDWQKPYR
jgi:hypothetical protein